LILITATLAGASSAPGQDYTNFIRQVQTVSGVEWDVQVERTGAQLSPLAIDPGGAHFELWTIEQNPLKDFLVDHKYVASYIPVASVRIYSEDPYEVIPRTRVDRPFNVEIGIDGLITSDPSAPDAAKKVNVFRYVQAYGEGGDGTTIERSLATLDSQVAITENGWHVYQFRLSAVPGAERMDVRGEERFVVESLDDYFKLPPFEIHLDDLYPDSQTWAQVYPGTQQLGVEGTTVPGSAVVIADSVPQDRVLRISDWDEALGDDGIWTLELLHKTPFGLERLSYITFEINRTMEVHGSVTTIE
jgi:hypothetical protein